MTRFVRRVYVAAIFLLLVSACSSEKNSASPGDWLVVGDEGGSLHAEPDPSMLPESLGFFGFKNGGDAAVELEEIVALDADPGLEVLGFRLYRGTGNISAWCGYPPRGLTTEPIRGATVDPDEMIGIWVGLTTQKVNVPLNVSKYEVRYKVGDVPYVQTLEYGLGITAKPDPSSHCPTQLPGPPPS